MKNISCKIIEDLLPLYVDGICNDESRNAVATHLETCSECHEKYMQMNHVLPHDEIQSNIGESNMIKKLSDTVHSKTKFNYRASAFCIIFYALFVSSLLFLSTYYEQGYLRLKINYVYALIGITLGLYLLFGMLLAFLANRQRGSTKTMILELIVIGIPSLLMATSIFTIYHLPFGFLRVILENVQTVTMIGSTLLGCELFRVITKK